MTSCPPRGLLVFYRCEEAQTRCQEQDEEGMTRDRHTLPWMTAAIIATTKKCVGGKIKGGALFLKRTPHFDFPIAASLPFKKCFLSCPIICRTRLKMPQAFHNVQGSRREKAPRVDFAPLKMPWEYSLKSPTRQRSHLLTTDPPEYLSMPIYTCLFAS